MNHTWVRVLFTNHPHIQGSKSKKEARSGSLKKKKKNLRVGAFSGVADHVPVPSTTTLQCRALCPGRHLEAQAGLRSPGCGQASPLVNGVPLDKPPDLPEHVVPIPVTSWDGVGVGFK